MRYGPDIFKKRGPLVKLGKVTNEKEKKNNNKIVWCIGLMVHSVQRLLLFIKQGVHKVSLQFEKFIELVVDRSF